MSVDWISPESRRKHESKEPDEERSAPWSGEVRRHIGRRASAHLHRWTGLALAMQDIAVFQVCVWSALGIRTVLEAWFPISLSWSNYGGVVAGVTILPLMFYGLGLYPGSGVAPPERFRRQIVGMTAAFSALVVWDAIVQQGLWSRGVLLITWALAVCLVPLSSRWTIRILVQSGMWGEPVLVVGPAAHVESLVSNLKEHEELGYRPVGYLSSDEDGNRVDVSVPFLGRAEDVNKFAELAKTVIVVPHRKTRHDDTNLVETLDFPTVIVVPDALEGQGMWVSACDLGRTSGLRINRSLLIPTNHRIKRIFDCAVAGPLFIVVLPMLALLCCLIMLISPGKPFFSQMRVGRSGRPFAMLKLRTMIPNAERRVNSSVSSKPPAGKERRSHLKPRRDPRILPVIGSFLRTSSLDELPQLWNVLRGDMSLVGPRPFPHYHLNAFSTAFRELRQTAMPGLSGLWQIEARSDSDLAMQEELDRYYIRNWSLWLDLYILTRTLSAVLSARGAR